MEEATTHERMAKAVREYFKAEKMGAVALLGWGLLSVAIAWLFGQQQEGALFKGMVPSVLALALVQLAVGATVYVRAGKLQRFLLGQLAGAGTSWLPAERGRMEKVLANFNKIKTAEQLLFLLGFGSLLGGAFMGGGEYMAGAGIGLCVQSAFSLVFDLFASLRAALYFHELNVFGRV